MVRLLIAALSAVAGALAVGLLFLLAGVPHTVFGWVWGIVIFGLGFVLARVCLSLGLNTSTAFETGAREAASQLRGDSFEATGRKAGAVVGKGLNKVARIGAPKPAAQPSPTPPPSGGPATSPAPDVTVDKAARVLGSMVGRRLGERKK